MLAVPMLFVLFHRGVLAQDEPPHQPEVGGQWRVGAMAMDGEGSPVTGYVSIAWLESRRWVRLPEDGARLSLWFEQKTNRLGRKGSWSGHLFWSPSQQETFRCGLRWSWEA